MNGGKGFQVNYGDVNLSGVVYVDTDKKDFYSNSLLKLHPLIESTTWIDPIISVIPNWFGDDLLAFKPVVKVERWNETTHQWDNITDPKWKTLTSRTDKCVSSGELGTHVYRFTFDTQRDCATFDGYLLMRFTWTDSINSIIIETSRDNFTTINVLLNKSNLNLYVDRQYVVVIPPKVDNCGRYIRVTLNVTSESSTSIYFCQFYYIDEGGQSITSNFALTPWKWDNDLHVGLGTDSPDALLEIEGNPADFHIDSNYYAYIHLDSAYNEDNILSFEYDGVPYWRIGMDNSNTGDFVIEKDNNQNPPVFLIDNNNQNIGINTTSPQYTLDVNGDIRTTGCLYYNGGTLGTCASSKSIKTNIHNLTFTNALSKIMRLQPKAFEYKKEPGREYHGLIAEDVEKVAPELVVEINGTKYVRYGDVRWLILEAVKELKQENDQYRKALCELRDFEFCKG